MKEKMEDVSILSKTFATKTTVNNQMQVIDELKKERNEFLERKAFYQERAKKAQEENCQLRDAVSSRFQARRRNRRKRRRKYVFRPRPLLPNHLYRVIQEIV